ARWPRRGWITSRWARSPRMCRPWTSPCASISGITESRRRRHGGPDHRGSSMSGLIFALIVIAALWVLAYFAAPLWAWTVAAGFMLLADGWLCHVAPTVGWVVFAILAVLL